jgi:hypothetical protein
MLGFIKKTPTKSANINLYVREKIFKRGIILQAVFHILLPDISPVWNRHKTALAYTPPTKDSL